MLNIQNQDNQTPFTPTYTLDNRQGEQSSDHMWDLLNLSQQYAVCSLGQFGYLLTFVRSVAGSTIAILKQNGKVATVNSSGEINVNPTITYR